MNVYVDIDGVLLANEENLAIGAAEFIKYAADNFDVYWLTTHCMDGTTDHAIEYLQRPIFYSGIARQKHTMSHQKPPR